MTEAITTSIMQRSAQCQVQQSRINIKMLGNLILAKRRFLKGAQHLAINQLLEKLSPYPSLVRAILAIFKDTKENVKLLSQMKKR